MQIFTGAQTHRFRSASRCVRAEQMCQVNGNDDDDDDSGGALMFEQLCQRSVVPCLLQRGALLLCCRHTRERQQLFELN